MRISRALWHTKANIIEGMRGICYRDLYTDNLPAYL